MKKEELTELQISYSVVNQCLRDLEELRPALKEYLEEYETLHLEMAISELGPLLEILDEVIDLKEGLLRLEEDSADGS